MFVPKLLKAKATVYTCNGCGKWLLRHPCFMGIPFDKGDHCEKCGCTSVKMRSGRSFGPRSKQWKTIVEWWELVYDDEFWDVFPDLIGSVVTDPPFQGIIR
jgi:hypothetical protein